VLSSLGVGASRNGRIPFTPSPRPSQFNGSFFGHVYVQEEVNVPVIAYADPNVITALNVNLNGKIVINVDATGDKLLYDYLVAHPEVTLGGFWAVGQLGAAFAGNPALFHNLAVGANASVGVNASVFFPQAATLGGNVTLTLAKASAIFTGTASPELYFRGEASDNLVRGTVLEPYMRYVRPTRTYIVDGAASAGFFNASYTTEYAFFGASATLSTNVLGTGLNGPTPMLQASINGQAHVPGVTTTNANLTGFILQSGVFQIDGAATLSIAGFTLAQGQFRIVNQGITVKGQLNLGPVGAATVASALTTNGQYILVGTFQTDWGIAFAPKVDASLVLTNTGLRATTTVAFLGQQAFLQGSFQTNFDFSLSGSVKAGFNVLGQSVAAKTSVILAGAAGVTSLRGDLGFNVKALGSRLSLMMTLFLSFAGIGIPTYAGVGSASATDPVFGTTVTVAVAVVNNAMVIDLPFLPIITIPLPF
ncbi:MAG: hypothetical protein AB7I30_22820, partial [Isosphaeraceae bacterium]